MECNKEEAIRAREIAERKLTEKDFAGAKRFALKAQALYSDLEGILQILTTLEVYIASEIKVNGEIDWYGVLGVNPSADDEAIRKQYRKLALVLHPDKNKSTGADGAFKILSEAWSLLSDKPKRVAYNERRFSKGIQQSILMKCRAAAPPPNANGFHNVSKRSISNAKVAKTPRVQFSQASRPQPRTDTFWTICLKCNMHYEYLRVYLNHTLLCPNCHKPFHASETSPPVSYRASNGINPGRGSASSSNYKNVPGAQFNTEKRKQEYEVAPGADSLLKKRRGLNDYRSSEAETHTKSNITRDFMQLDLRSLLVEKARAEVCKKLSVWHLEDVTKSLEAMKEKQMQREREEEAMKEKQMMKEREKEALREKQMQKEREKEAMKEKQKQNEREKGIEKNSVNGNTFEDYRNGVLSSSSTVADDRDKEVIEPVEMNVPDPDFYDFDQDRTENSFQENQVWATYDDDDGMPRLYAYIRKVVSKNPFQVEISWLKSKTNSEFSPLEWVSLGFHKTCGEFRNGKHENSRSLNAFSHKVDWKNGPRGIIRIYPKQGDVWALYRNWSCDWNEHTPDDIIHKYDMVEVLADYNEDEGVVYITPLIKVCGFKTVFRTQANPDSVRRISREEMFRFSHKVPNHKLTGCEGPNAPKGCLELDPAATPSDLLQIIEEEKKEKSRGEPMLKYSRKKHHHP